MNYEKGDILEGEGVKAIHPIVFYEDRNPHTVVGLMITTEPRYKDNVLMKESHFEPTDENDTPYKIVFKNSHLVRAKFIKKQDWEPFDKVGKLTNEGVAFIESQVADKQPQDFDIYELSSERIQE